MRVGAVRCHGPGTWRRGRRHGEPRVADRLDAGPPPARRGRSGPRRSPPPRSAPGRRRDPARRDTPGRARRSPRPATRASRRRRGTPGPGPAGRRGTSPAGRAPGAPPPRDRRRARSPGIGRAPGLRPHASRPAPPGRDGSDGPPSARRAHPSSPAGPPSSAGVVGRSDGRATRRTGSRRRSRARWPRPPAPATRTTPAMTSSIAAVSPRKPPARAIDSRAPDSITRPRSWPMPRWRTSSGSRLSAPTRRRRLRTAPPRIASWPAAAVAIEPKRDQGQEQEQPRHEPAGIEPARQGHATHEPQERTQSPWASTWATTKRAEQAREARLARLFREARRAAGAHQPAAADPRRGEVLPQQGFADPRPPSRRVPSRRGAARPRPRHGASSRSQSAARIRSGATRAVVRSGLRRDTRRRSWPRTTRNRGSDRSGEPHERGPGSVAEGRHLRIGHRHRHGFDPEPLGGRLDPRLESPASLRRDPDRRAVGVGSGESIPSPRSTSQQRAGLRRAARRARHGQ